MLPLGMPVWGTFCRQPAYVAPEFLFRDCGFSSDIFQFGCTAFVLLTGRPLFPAPEHLTFDEASRSQLKRRGHPDFEQRLAEAGASSAKGLLKQALRYYPGNRSSAEQLLDLLPGAVKEGR